MATPDAEFLRSVLDYNPETGNFTWKKRRDVPNKWNVRWAGEKAGRINKAGYVGISINKVRYYAHRLAWLYQTGEWPTRPVDHRDTNKSNNQWSNLRLANHSTNGFNRSAQKNNRCGIKGIYWHTKLGKWIAQINYQGNHKYIGCFSTPEQAKTAYDEAAKQLHGEFARAS